MAGLDALKDIIKPPFANYDVVVYFGCGLFVLPFAQHYIWHGAKVPVSVDFKLAPDLVNVVVTVLVVLFTVYIIGHIIAYVASITIEKGVDFFFGKTSTVVLTSAEKGTQNATFRELLRDGAKNAFGPSTWAAGVFRAAVHLPAYPAYLIIYVMGIFGYYRSRVPKSVIELARTKLPAIGLQAADLSASEKWYKPLEASVVNKHPGASTRMYNYLVISGLFRSLSLIFLGSMWFELVYLVSYLFGKEPYEGILMFGVTNGWGELMSYLGIALVYIFCLFSYLKFQRRYVEEAIFAFVFA